MTPRLRRAVLLVAALLLLAAGVYRWPLSSAFVAGHIGPRDWPASVTMRGPGRASLSLLPSPVLRLVDAEWRGPDGASLLTAQHADIRIGLLPLLAGRFEIVGTAADGLQAVHKAELLRPELVLADLSMPQMTGLEAAKELRKSFAELRILIFTGLNGASLQDECLRCGADGFVEKSQMPEGLMEEVRRLFPEISGELG